MMSSSEDNSAGLSVKRTARIKEQGENYSLKLMANGKKEGRIFAFNSGRQKIDDRLTLIDDEGDTFEDNPTYSYVTKGCIIVADDGKGNKYKYAVENPTPFEQKHPANAALDKKPATILDIARSKGLSNMDKEDLVSLSQEHAPRSCKFSHVEPGKHIPFVSRELEMLELTEELDTLLRTTHRDDKNSKLVCEYPTISGAGKTRWIFQAFIGFESSVYSGLEVFVVHINFNGSDRGWDCYTVDKEDVSPLNAACRLLLSRGLLGCSPDLDWLTIAAEFDDKMLPNVFDVRDAIFDRCFGTGGTALLIVHLDELSILKERRIIQDKSKDANLWIKDFLYAFASLTDNTAQKFVVPVITHTNPAGRIMGPKKLSQVRHVQLKLYPLNMEQSWQLLDAARKNPAPDPKIDAAAQEPLESFSDHEKERWTPCVALAGGHPSLLLDCYRPLYTSRDPGFQLTTVGTIVTNLQNHHRVAKKLGAVTSVMASEFVYDVLTGALARELTHGPIIDAGLAWFLPTDIEEDMGEENGDANGEEKADEKAGDKADEYAGEIGTVSTPYPYLVKLMARAGSMYAAVARNINALDRNYRPTKAMEYVAALAVSLHLLGKVDHWIENIKVGTRKAIQKISTENRNFICVWPSSIEPGTDFGGKVFEQDENTGKAVPVAYIGQVKMQEPGADSTQGLAEVMDLAWFIGRSVRSGELNSRVRAFFVSSRKAPRDSKMEGLVHAFRVAMSGQQTRDEAKTAAAARYHKKEAKVNITDVIELFQSYAPSEQFQFTYIGRSIKGSDLVLEMHELLPTGIFTGWH